MKLLPVREFAERLGISIWTARSMCYRGKVASVKIGTRLLVPETEIARLIEENYRPSLSESRR